MPVRNHFKQRFPTKCVVPFEIGIQTFLLNHRGKAHPCSETNEQGDFP